MRVRVAALVVVVVLAAVAVPAGADGGAPTDGGGGDEDAPILVLGDSLCVGARQHEAGLAVQLEEAGWDATFRCRSGEPVAWGLAEVDEMTTVPPVVVVALGTNPWAVEPGFADRLDQLRAALVDRGATRLVWVDYADRAGRYRGKSHQLHRFAARHGDEVVPWAATAADNPEWFRSDGIHYEPPGVLAWSSTIAVTVATPDLDPVLRRAVERLSLALAHRMDAAALASSPAAGRPRSAR